jgi:GGDEF domain-containing protein
MNGLKQIKDLCEHDVGDCALKAYFHAVASFLGDRGQSYCLSGGADEVLAVLPNHDDESAVRIVQMVYRKLMSVRLWPEEPGNPLSMAAGVITSRESSESPAALRVASDEEQKKANHRSREMTPRPSVIAVKGEANMIVIEPGSEAGNSHD